MELAEQLVAELHRPSPAVQAGQRREPHRTGGEEALAEACADHGSEHGRPRLHHLEEAADVDDRLLPRARRPELAPIRLDRLQLPLPDRAYVDDERRLER